MSVVGESHLGKFSSEKLQRRVDSVFREVRGTHALVGVDRLAV